MQAWTAYSINWQRVLHGYEKVCKNNIRLFELYDFLRVVPEDFVATLTIAFTSLGREINARTLNAEMGFEFSVGMEGLALMDSEWFFLTHADADITKGKWRELCIQRGYENDFSRAINNGVLHMPSNAILYLSDGVKVYRESALY